MKYRITIATACALTLLLGSSGAGLAQTSPADSITDESGVAGLDLTVSESIDFAAQGVVARDGQEVPSGWLKVFVSDLDTVSISAVELPNVDALRAALAGAMADIDRRDRKLHAALDGVVVGDLSRQGQPARYALYGEGLTSFTIVASGPNRDRLGDRLLLVQVEHSTGDRFPLRTDETERYRGERDQSNLAYDLGRLAGWSLLTVGVIALIRRYWKRDRPGSARPDAADSRPSRR